MCRRRSTACCKAAREGRRAQEEVRVAGFQGKPVSWLRLRVRPLGDTGRSDRKLTFWTVADVTRDRERQENVFQELQHAIDYLDHAPAGFFSVDAGGNIGYLNATLAAWLDHDLAQVGSGGLKLTDIVSGNGAALLTTVGPSARRGEDRGARPRLQDPRRAQRAGAAVPQGRVRRRRHARRLAHAGAQPRPRRGGRSRARRRSALHALLPDDADGDRDRRQGRQDRAHQCAVRAAVPGDADRGRKRGALDPRGGLRARPRSARSRDPKRRRRPGRSRAGRRGAGRQRRALGTVLRLAGRGGGARHRGGDRLRAGDHRCSACCRAARPGARR